MKENGKVEMIENICEKSRQRHIDRESFKEGEIDLEMKEERRREKEREKED